MISKLSQKITQNLIKANIVHNEDFDLYNYGLFIFISEAFLFIYCLTIGAIWGIILPSISFYIVFLILHRFSGGVHVKSELHCQLITLSFFLISIMTIKHLIFANHILLFSTYVFCTIILIIFSPADTPQKPLNKKEKVLFKKITTLILVVLFVIISLLNFMGWHFYTNALLVAIFLQTISVICGRLFNKRLLSQNS